MATNTVTRKNARLGELRLWYFRLRRLKCSRFNLKSSAVGLQAYQNVTMVLTQIAINLSGIKEKVVLGKVPPSNYILLSTCFRG